MIREAIAHSIDASEMRKNAYYLDLYMIDWASMVQRLRLLQSDADLSSRRDEALALKSDTFNSIAQLTSFGDPIVEAARSEGKLVELPDNKCPVGTYYHFDGMETQCTFSKLIMIQIVFNRILSGVEEIMCDGADAALDAKHESLCREIWKCFPYTRKASLMAAIQFGDAMYLSLEGARGAEKEYVLTYLLEVSSYRKRVPNDRDRVYEYVLETARGLTGRLPLRERTDFPYWEQSSKVQMQQAK
jgi:hypothetical protein